MGEEIIVPSKDGGSFSAYLAVPETTPAGAVVVIQEIFGVNEGIRGKCDWLAREGFLALAPDLFWRLEPNVQLTDKTQQEWEKAFALMNAFDTDKGIEDLRAAKHLLRGHAYGNGKVGCLGYCLGGKLAYLLGCRSDIDASVGYYGVGLDELTDEAQKLTGQIMLHIAEEDQFVSKEAQAKIHQDLGGNDKITLHSYAGMNHAFTRVGGDHYDEAAAKIADERSIAFLKEHLSR